MANLSKCITNIRNIPEYNEYPTSKTYLLRDVSSLQRQLTNHLRSCPVEKVKQLLLMCYTLNDLVSRSFDDHKDSSTEVLIPLFEGKIQQFVEENLPFAKCVARCSTNRKMVSCNNGHIHLVLKTGTLPNNAFVCGVNGFEDLSKQGVLKRLRVVAFTQDKTPTKEDVVFVFESDLKNLPLVRGTTTVVQLKVNERANTLDIKAHVCETEDSTRMPFSPGPPLTKASCDGLTWDGQSALTKCDSFSDGVVLIRIFRDDAFAV